MKTKNYSAFALAAVLLITAALVISCPEPMGPGGWGGGFTPRASRAGYLTLNLAGDTGGRTLLPSTTLSDFKFYQVDIEGQGGTGSGNNLTKATLAVDSSGIADVQIPAGTYNVMVYAYTSTNASALAARGFENNVVVNPSTHVTPGGTASITLESTAIDGTTNGTFTWDFTLPQTSGGSPTDDVDTATITVTPYGTTTPVTTIDELSIKGTASSGTDTLLSGYYKVVVSLEKTGHQTKTVSEIMHIYPNQTTPFDRTFTALAPTLYQVTYHNIDGSGNSATQVDNNGGTKFTHGNTIRNYYSSSGPGLDDPTDTENGYGFGGWFKETSHANQWVFLTDRIIKDTDLYAKWNPPLGIEITVTFTAPGDLVLIFDGGSNTQSFAQGLLQGTTVTVTLNSVSTTYESISWEHNSATITDADSDTNPLTFDLSFANGGNVGLPVAGHTYEFTIVIVVEENKGTTESPNLVSVPYTGHFSIEVTADP
ncbi:MAG: hypothetical protein LBQ89_05245 [Treponema sp.]|nr:hypothetical protein [Treponema sp.]